MAKKVVSSKLKPINRRRPVLPPRLPSIPTFPKGPRLYQVPDALRRGTTGPGEPPPGFVTATTSRIEWAYYWALFKVLVPSENPRKGPFVGYPGVFSYQSSFAGGRSRLGGGAVIDFVVEPHPLTNGQPVALRIQTERFHLFTDQVKQAREQLYRDRMSRYYVVRDLYEQNVLFDKTGQAVVIAVKNALRGVIEPNPVRGGTPLRIPDRSL